MVQANTPQKRRRTGLTGLIMLALFLVGAAAIALMPTPVRDDYMISLQRHYRVWLSSTGQSIPGTPDPESYAPADPGEYRLTSTAEVVVDPDYLTTWTRHPPDRH